MKSVTPCFFQFVCNVSGEDKMPYKITKAAMVFLRYLLTVTIKRPKILCSNGFTILPNFTMNTVLYFSLQCQLRLDNLLLPVYFLISLVDWTTTFCVNFQFKKARNQNQGQAQCLTASVISVVTIQLQLQLKLSFFRFFSYSFSYSYFFQLLLQLIDLSVTVTVILNKFTNTQRRIQNHIFHQLHLSVHSKVCHRVGHCQAQCL